jgi:putative Ca2+/H+ antiporter (TMEM165/GDT1 family)
MNNLQHFFNALSAVNFSEAVYGPLQHFLSLLATGNITELSATTATSFALIVAAEFGDKSQLVCMALASRHRAMPVMLGAIAAFAFLNTLAVVFGVVIAGWLPPLGYMPYACRKRMMERLFRKKAVTVFSLPLFY